MAAPLPGLGQSVQALIGQDDASWHRFEVRLDRIESTKVGWNITEDLLGLPLSGELSRARKRERDRQEAAAERKRQEFETAAQARLVAVTVRAESVFGPAAAGDWLRRPSRTGGPSPAEAAQSGLDGLEKVLRA